MSDPGELSRTFLTELLQSVRSVVAVADATSWEPLLETARFFELFPPDPAEPDQPLSERVPGLDVARAGERLARGRPYSVEVDVKAGARTVSIDLALHASTLDGREVVLLEGSDVTKRKETEYMLDSYSRMAEKNARELQREKERAEKLLLNIMPRAVFEEMKDFGSVSPARFDEATILMLDFVDFTEMTVSQNPGELVSELNDIFSAFDRIVELFNCERMKPIGHAYLAGSIVGVQKYVYDIFGPGVNMAARMEAVAEPMQIVITSDTYRRIREEFTCSDLGTHEIKGFGTQHLYSLDAEWSHRR